MFPRIGLFQPINDAAAKMRLSSDTQQAMRMALQEAFKEWDRKESRPAYKQMYRRIRKARSKTYKISRPSAMAGMMTLQRRFRRYTRDAGCHSGRLRHIEVTCVPRTEGEGFITMSGWFKFCYGRRSRWKADFEVRKRYLRRSRSKPTRRREGTSAAPSVQTREQATQSTQDMASTEAAPTTAVQTVSFATVDQQPEDSGGEERGITAQRARIKQSKESSSSALADPTSGQESQEQRGKPPSHEPKSEASTEGTDPSALSDVQREPANETLPLATTVDGATETSKKLVSTFETGEPGDGAPEENAKLPASARANASNLPTVQQQTGRELACDAPAASKNGITEASQPPTGVPQVVPGSPAESSHHQATRAGSAAEDEGKNASLTPVSYNSSAKFVVAYNRVQHLTGRR
jgi:hypothetical protein